VYARLITDSQDYGVHGNPFLEEVAVVFGIVKEMTFSIAGDVIMLSMEGFPL
jgi:hypothetical protein